ncbi:hypothetical protein ACZ90_70325 [Streptomyces albus subsp. albus]|nr:hypothetical protein ACZ90_70325 [Streptomyces albus subsp. albus]
MSVSDRQAIEAPDATDFRELSDRAQLHDLLARQGRWLDERRFDEAADIFTPDAVARTQGGESHGLAALVAQARRTHERFACTQHFTTNALIDLDGDRAVLRANLLAVFVPQSADATPVPVGERYRFEAVRTAQGWRFSRVEADLIWRSGDLPQAA